MNLLKTIYNLVRFPNLLIVAFTQFWCALILVHPVNYSMVYTNPKLYFVILSTMLIAAAGYLINDYYDIKIDYVNKPNRVIIGKAIKRRQVLITHSTLNFLGITLGVLVSWWMVGLNSIAVFLLWLYSNQLKRMPLWGNLVVSLLTGLAVLAIYVLYQTNLKLISTYSIFAFFISLIREIVKDIEDVEGDEKFGCRTLPVTLGISATKKVIYFLTILFITVTAIITYKIAMFLPFISGLTFILLFFCVKLYLADKKQDFTRLSSMAKLIMVLGIFSMVLM